MFRVFFLLRRLSFVVLLSMSLSVVLYILYSVETKLFIFSQQKLQVCCKVVFNQWKKIIYGRIWFQERATDKYNSSWCACMHYTYFQDHAFNRSVSFRDIVNFPNQSYGRKRSHQDLMRSTTAITAITHFGSRLFAIMCLLPTECGARWRLIWICAWAEAWVSRDEYSTHTSRCC